MKRFLSVFWLLLSIQVVLPVLSQVKSEPKTWVEAFFAEKAECEYEWGYAPTLHLFPGYSTDKRFTCSYAMVARKDGEVVSRDIIWEDKSWWNNICSMSTGGVCYFNGLDDGVYKLTIDYKIEDGEWKPCINSDSIFIEMEISNKKAYFRNRVINGDGFKATQLEIDGKRLVNQILTPQVTVVNNTDGHYHSLFMYINDKLEGVGTFYNLEKGASYTLSFRDLSLLDPLNYKARKAGDYTFSVVDGDGNTVLSETVKIEDSPIVNLIPVSYSFENQDGDHVPDNSVKLHVNLKNDSDNDYDSQLRVIMQGLYENNPNDTILVKYQFGWDGEEADFYPASIPAHETREFVFDFGGFEDIECNPHVVTIFYFSGNEELVALKTDFFTIGDKASDISNIQAGRYEPHDVYNLQGAKVGTTEHMDTLPPGIYIVDKKKIVKR
jgi:hypothetical protein